ncbi:MAG TPA: hypothetical protein VFR23_24700 [Jiangellaceae bacterium]|nr:hypothetical protein [Jiangellaceae bacterium]
MPGPPEDVSAGELFQKLLGPLPSEVVPFPRRTADGRPVGTVRLQLVRPDDRALARTLGLKRARDRFKLEREDQDSAIGAGVVSDCVVAELLAMVCRTEENYGNDEKPFYPLVFKDADAVGQTLSSDEMAVLYNCFLLVEAKYGPFDKTIQSETDLSAWIKRLVEGAAEFPLQQLSSVHWADAASLLAVRAYTLSVILESLFSSLPSSLASSLAKYSLGTGFFGSLAPSTSGDGTATSLDLRIPDWEVTTDDARDMAERAKAAEERVLAALAEAEKLKILSE